MLETRSTKADGRMPHAAGGAAALPRRGSLRDKASPGATCATAARWKGAGVETCAASAFRRNKSQEVFTRAPVQIQDGLRDFAHVQAAGRHHRWETEVQMLTTFEPLGRDGLVVSVFGDLDTDDMASLRERLFACVDMGFRRTFIDMGRCRLLDWSGLDVLIETARRADGREVAVLSPTRELRTILDVSGLSIAMPIYRSRAEALRQPLAVA